MERIFTSVSQTSKGEIKMMNKEQKKGGKSKKVSYKKPVLKKEGSLRDITSGGVGSFGPVMILNPKRKVKSGKQIS